MIAIFLFSFIKFYKFIYQIIFNVNKNDYNYNNMKSCFESNSYLNST